MKILLAIFIQIILLSTQADAATLSRDFNLDGENYKIIAKDGSEFGYLFIIRPAGYGQRYGIVNTTNKPRNIHLKCSDKHGSVTEQLRLKPGSIDFYKGQPLISGAHRGIVGESLRSGCMTSRIEVILQ